MVTTAAAATLDAEGIPTRVVVMPSWELFNEADAAWRERVLPGAPYLSKVPIAGAAP